MQPERRDGESDTQSDSNIRKRTLKSIYRNVHHLRFSAFCALYCFSFRACNGTASAPQIESSVTKLTTIILNCTKKKTLILNWNAFCMWNTIRITRKSQSINSTLIKGVANVAFIFVPLLPSLWRYPSFLLLCRLFHFCFDFHISLSLSLFVCLFFSNFNFQFL